MIDENDDWLNGEEADRVNSGLVTCPVRVDRPPQRWPLPTRTVCGARITNLELYECASIEEIHERHKESE